MSLLGLRIPAKGLITRFENIAFVLRSETWNKFPAVSVVSDSTTISNRSLDLRSICSVITTLNVNYSVTSSSLLKIGFLIER